MNAELLTVGLANLAVGILCITLCLPLVQRKVAMNHWYGVRIPKAFASDENWYRVNEFGGRSMIRWSLPVLVIGLFTTIVAILGLEAFSPDISQKESRGC